MFKQDKNKEYNEQPILFWSSIGAAIGSSISVVLNMETLGLLLSIGAGVAIGATVGYFSNKK